MAEAPLHKEPAAILMFFHRRRLILTRQSRGTEGSCRCGMPVDKYGSRKSTASGMEERRDGDPVLRRKVVSGKNLIEGSTAPCSGAGCSSSSGRKFSRK